MTPIRVRGKRHGTPAEKWNAGKQRKVLDADLATTSQLSSGAQPSSSDAKPLSRRRRRRHTPELSRLELLPSEALQTIFEYSANVDLPLASPRLASQLTSQHLYHSVTTKVLQTVLGGMESTPAELLPAVRLMESKFFTSTFFQDWLFDQFDSLDLHREWCEAMDSGLPPEHMDEWTWLKLQPPSGFLPPKKLLRGPFTEDKIRFFRSITSSRQGFLDHLDPLYSELAKEGLHSAVSEGAAEALPAFWKLGMVPDTGLLRLAVIDSGCEEDVVKRLILRTLTAQLSLYPVDVDFLDPALWSWADTDDTYGKGLWLMESLRDAARTKTQQHVLFART